MIYSFSTFLWLQYVVRTIIAAASDASANSPSMSLSVTLIFGARNFRSRPIWYENLENRVDLWRRFLEGISGRVQVCWAYIMGIVLII